MKVSGAYAEGVADEPAGDSDEAAEDGGRNWGRVLDGAGIVAGVVLAVIVIDIWSDGRLISRRLRGGQAEAEGEDDDERPGGE